MYCGNIMAHYSKIGARLARTDASGRAKLAGNGGRERTNWKRARNGCGACLARTEASGRARHSKEWVGEMFSMLELKSRCAPARIWGWWGGVGATQRGPAQHTHAPYFALDICVMHQDRVQSAAEPAPASLSPRPRHEPWL